MLAETRIIELPELGVERLVAQTAVDALRGKTIVNEATGICARLSSSARGKLVSNKATGKSKANGFSRQQHNAIVARIADIYRMAALLVSRPDRAGDANILSIKRFAAKVKFGRQLAAAWITVKESKLHGHHIYSVEAIKLEALDRIVEVVSGNTPHASSAPTRGIVAFFSSCVNAVFGKISTNRSTLLAARRHGAHVESKHPLRRRRSETVDCHIKLKFAVPSHTRGHFCLMFRWIHTTAAEYVILQPSTRKVQPKRCVASAERLRPLR